MAYINVIKNNYDNDKVRTISVNKGELIILYGPFNSGKTSILDAISLNSKNDNIFVNINEKNIKKFNIKQRINYKKNIISYGSLYFIDSLTALENILLMCKVKKNYLDINTILSKFNIDDKINLYPKDLSKKELALLSISMAIIKNADIILIDDAIDNLDTALKLKTISTIKELCLNKTVILTSESIIENSNTKIIDVVSGKIISKSSKSNKKVTKKSKVKSVKSKTKWLLI